METYMKDMKKELAKKESNRLYERMQNNKMFSKHVSTCSSKEDKDTGEGTEKY